MLKAPPRPDPPKLQAPAQPRQGSAVSSAHPGEAWLLLIRGFTEGLASRRAPGRKAAARQAAPRPAHGQPRGRPRPRQTCGRSGRLRDGRRPGRVPTPSSLLKPTAPLTRVPAPLHQALRPPRRHPCGPACGHGFAQAEAASEPHRREAAVPVTAPNPTCNLPHVQKALETGF